MRREKVHIGNAGKLAGEKEGRKWEKKVHDKKEKSVSLRKGDS